MNSTIDFLRTELQKSKQQNIPISDELKNKILDLISDDISVRKIAKTLGIHHTTIIRWGQKSDEMDNSGLCLPGDTTPMHHLESGACTSHAPSLHHLKVVPPLTHHPCTSEDKLLKLKDSPPCTTPAPQKLSGAHKRAPLGNNHAPVVPPPIPISILGLLISIFVLCEYYLLNEAYKFHSITLNETKYALIKSLLGELIPIGLATVLSVCKVKILYKILANFVFIFSFIFSAYTSGAYQFNQQSDQLKTHQILINEEKRIEDAIKEKKQNIEYFKNMIQKSSGIKGWPLQVIKYEQELVTLQSEMKLIHEKINGVGDSKVKNINRWIDVFFKIFLQLSAVMITPILLSNTVKEKALAPLSTRHLR